MGFEKMQNQDMGLLLTSEVKPRLKWNSELHQLFLEAVSQLGGAEKATPKKLMRMMGVPGLTLYHLKSHLQKYRVGNNQQPKVFRTKEDFLEGDNRDSEIIGDHISEDIIDGTQMQINKRFRMDQALKLQIEMQKKLHEQIEVQGHLQLRIEAQGKYLQMLLKKAQETLAGCKSTTMEFEAAKFELSQLVNMVDSRSPSPSFSGLTETGDLILQKVGKRSIRGSDCSIESSLTSSESTGRKDKRQQRIRRENIHEINPNEGLSRTGLNNGLEEQKRSNDTCVDQRSTETSPTFKEKSGNQLRKLGHSKELDLNSQYPSNTDSDWLKLVAL